MINTTRTLNLRVIHFNSRSLYANFNNTKNYLCTFYKPFNVIAISETWIDTEKGIDFELDGYELIRVVEGLPY